MTIEETAASRAHVHGVVRRLCWVVVQLLGVFLIFASGFGFGTMQSYLSDHYKSLPAWMGFACAVSGWIFIRVKVYGLN